jgi:hypothetical protein
MAPVCPHSLAARSRAVGHRHSPSLLLTAYPSPSRVSALSATGHWRPASVVRRCPGHQRSRRVHPPCGSGGGSCAGGGGAGCARCIGGGGVGAGPRPVAPCDGARGARGESPGAFRRLRQQPARLLLAEARCSPRPSSPTSFFTPQCLQPPIAAPTAHRRHSSLSQLAAARLAAQASHPCPQHPPVVPVACAGNLLQRPASPALFGGWQPAALPAALAARSPISPPSRRRRVVAPVHSPHLSPTFTTAALVQVRPSRSPLPLAAHRSSPTALTAAAQSQPRLAAATQARHPRSGLLPLLRLAAVPPLVIEVGQ